MANNININFAITLRNRQSSKIMYYRILSQMSQCHVCHFVVYNTCTVYLVHVHQQDIVHLLYQSTHWIHLLCPIMLSFLIKKYRSNDGVSVLFCTTRTIAHRLDKAENMFIVNLFFLVISFKLEEIAAV